MLKKLIGAFIVCASLAGSRASYGQDVFTDVVREAVDEARLRHDYRALQRDLANGNTAAAQYDLMRIQQDRINLARDEIQLNYDLNRTGSLSSYPAYPSYYVPSTAGQMTYFTPIAQTPQQVLPPLNAAPTVTPTVPSNPLPGAFQTVKISNPESTGMSLGFVLAGKTYSIDPGRTDEFSVAGPTLIVFSRGGPFGIARYTLTGGRTFEFRSDDSGWLLVQKQLDPISKSPDLVPSNPVPRPALLPSPIPVVSPSAPGGTSGQISVPGPGAIVP